jgi:hypothetical protein
MAKRRRCNWRDDVLSGLPEGFDYGNIRTVDDAESRTVDDAESLMFRLPKGDRGKAARGLYEHRDEIGHQASYAGIMAAWDHHAVTLQRREADLRRALNGEGK